MLVRCMRCLCEGLQPVQRIFTVTAAYLNELIGRGATILGWQGYITVTIASAMVLPVIYGCRPRTSNRSKVLDAG